MKKKLLNLSVIVICSLLIGLSWVGCSFNRQANGLVNPEQINHHVSRLSFGITPQQIATISSQGLDNYLTKQLNPTSIKESSQLITQIAQFDSLRQNSLDLWLNFREYNDLEKTLSSPREVQELRRKKNKYKNQIIREAKQTHIARAIYSSRQLEAVMTHFWLNHFNVFASKRIIGFWLADYENDIRNNALGNFRDLLAVTAHHPAMLVYLDNDLNIDPNSKNKRGNARGLNENYARELMELHTLGVDGGYTQQDVTNLARILTGWGIDYSGNQGDENNFRFFAARHDSTDKVFLGKTIKGQGIAEGEQALDMLANHPATAHFISYKLAQYFVADQPPESLVTSLSETFIASQGNIKAVLTTLFDSSEFNNPDYYNAKFQTPFQYLVSIVRASELKNANLIRINNMLNQLSMPIFGCITPDGYKNTEEAWLNPDAMLRRIGYAVHIANGSLSNDGKALDWSTLQATLGNRISRKTKQAIAEKPPKLKTALILGSPEMMYR